MKKNGFTLIEFMIVVAIIGILACVGIGAMGQRSEGVRSGVLVKLSNKGILFPSWEGELMLGSGNSGQTWDFSIYRGTNNTPQLVSALQNKMGQSVEIKYKQRMFVWPWMADTDYCIVEIK